MPSALRRSASSPAVRSVSAPYPYPAPAASSQSAAARTRAGRRRGASDANSRRVLADIEWWRVMQGQCETDRERENEQDDEPDRVDDVAPVDAHADDGPHTRLRTPEPQGALYTLREDTATSAASLYEYQGHSRGASDASSEDFPPSSTESTPPRAPSLPPLDTAPGFGLPLGIFPPRRPRTRNRSRSGSMTLASMSVASPSSTPTFPPAASVAPNSIFTISPSTRSAPPTNVNIFAPPSMPLLHSLSLSHMDTDLDVGVYTPAAHAQRHRGRATSFPGLTACSGTEDGAAA